MVKIILNKNTLFPGYFIFFIFLLVIVSSCNPTKYVPEDESLLYDNTVIINKEGIKKSDIEPYIKQKPNKKIFNTRFYLGLYNLSNLSKEKWPHSWLRKIGEEPVIYDEKATSKTKEQIQSYITSKGYFDSHVMETIETSDKKTKVFYNVDLLPPYTIRNLNYEIEDSVIRELFCFDSVNCVIERGKPYDVDVIQAERSRFEHFIRDMGFYTFSGDNIFFKIDSTIGHRKVDIKYIVRNFMKMDTAGNTSYSPHSVYRVKNIYVYPDFVPKDALEGGDAYNKSLDTTLYRGYYFISPDKKPDIKYDLIIQSLYIKPGSTFNVTNTEQSRLHLLALPGKIFRLVNISYNELPESEIGDLPGLPINCNIHLTLLSKQSYKIELEGTNSEGSLGGALNLKYQNKNLFHGAELFDLKLKGAYEAISQKNNYGSSQEYGIETNLTLPKFLIPFLEKESFIKKYNPKTLLTGAFNYQNMPLYARTMANATFGYTWNSGDYKSHIVNPVDFNLVNLLSIDSAYSEKIASSTYLKYSYEDVMILGATYSFIFNNQKINKSNDYWFLRLNTEASGNLLALGSKLTGQKKNSEGSYVVLDQTFAQYVRADIDIRYNVVMNDVSSFAYRAFVGVGIPYGNSKAIPFEKQYYGGGANGVRAWKVRTLGPGSYDLQNDSTLVNQTADIKIEANAEYRFKLFWILHGAVFVDAGNIWTYNNDITQPGSQFKFKNFYNDIAVGSGFGLRFDLKFVLLRTDLGMKLRDPSISSGSNWILANRSYNFSDDFSLVFAIGYPF